MSGRMIMRRYYSQSARESLRSIFKKMESKNYVKCDEDRDAAVVAAKRLGIPTNYVIQAYRNVIPGEVRASSDRTDVEWARKVDSQTASVSSDDFTKAFLWDDHSFMGHINTIRKRYDHALERSAVYELPQLVEYRSEYRKPDVKRNNLRFKHFAFLETGEQPRGASKIVMMFNPDNVPELTPEQIHKLKLLAGDRFDVFENEVKISCNRFEDQAQNKLYLARLYQRLLSAAKDSSDMFADIPIDPRRSLKHERKKFTIYPEHKFPEEWLRPDMAPKNEYKDGTLHSVMRDATKKQQW